MPTYKSIKRYYLLLEKLRRKLYPSFEDLRDYLNDHDFSISSRTLQRDIEQIRVEYGIQIEYDRHRNGYYIDKDASINTDSFLRFLEIVNTAQLLSDSLRESREALNFISFEGDGELRGIEHLDKLLLAIRNKRKISFTHCSYHTDIQKSHTVRPYLLKEYQGRWYVFGCSEELEEFRTFGLDRISDLSIHDDIFVPEKIDAHAQFDDIVGLNYSNNKKELITLSLTPVQGKYISALPLHRSQQITKKTSDEVQVELYLIPNFEFVQKILMLGPNVKVLQPQSLAEEVKKNLKAALKHYFD